MTEKKIRKNYFINKAFQGKFIMKFVGVVIATVVLTIGLYSISMYYKYHYKDNLYKSVLFEIKTTDLGPDWKKIEQILLNENIYTDDSVEKFLKTKKVSDLKPIDSNFDSDKIYDEIKKLKANFRIVNKSPRWTTPFKLILPNLLLANGLIIIFTFFYGIFYSHRIAGPMYNLEKSLREMAEQKKLRKIKFRKNDEFNNIANVFNEMVDAIENNSSK